LAHIQLTAGDSRVAFDVFVADLRTGELFREGQRVVLPNQSFVALAALLERPGELVSREELRARLWPDGRVVEFEQGLNAIINRLREALGDSAGAPKFVETLPRRGYRFIAPVVRPPVDAAVSSPPIAPTTGPTSTPATGAPASVPVRLYGLCFLLALLVVAVSLVGSGRGGAGAFANPSLQRLTSTLGREVSPSFAPDGHSFVFGWNGGAEGGFDLYIKRLDSEHLLRLTQAPAVAISPAWSPANGGQIAFSRITAEESGIYSIPATGGTTRLLTPASFLDESFMQLSWSPDARALAFSTLGPGGSSYIHVLTLDDLSKRTLQHPKGCADAGIPSFSPDGQQLAFVCTTSLAVYSVYVTNPSADNPRLLATLQGNPRGLTWSADGSDLILANDAGDGSALWQLTLNGKLSRVPGSEEALGPGLARMPTGIRDLSLSRDISLSRDLAFVREQQRFELWQIDLSVPTDRGSPLAVASRSQLVPQYSPEGARVVFQSSRSGSSEIWMADRDGRDPIQLTNFNGPLTGGPSWCSDGRRIAFDSRASGTSRIYLMDVPNGPSHPLATSQSNLSLPVWSADCQWIYASDGRATLYRVPTSGGAAEQFTHKRAYRAAVSGDKVIFNVARPAGIELWVRSAPGGEEQPLEGMPQLRYADDWSVARGGVYYTSAGSINFYDFASHHIEAVRPLTGAPAALGGLGMTVSPDGHWLVYTHSADWQGDIMMISGH
jgi:Tol biopolymer transport system component/DNA-binding winged helix-turn-helix (wHTH) protein